MANSSIFKYANDISMKRSTNSARSVSVGGYARTHRLGPSLINLDVDLPLLTEAQYEEVNNELFTIDDGIKFLNVNISSNNGNNIITKTNIPLKAGETEIKFINTSYSSLRQITLTNLQPNTNNIFKVGDFLQFSNHDKVYQISKPLGSTGTDFNTTNAGTCEVRLSTPFVSNVNVPTNTSVGNAVQYMIVNGKADTSEQVSYDWVGGSGTNSQGLITFTDTLGNPYQYEDGSYAVCHILSGLYTANDIRNTITAAIAGNAPGGLTQAEQDANNKLGEILTTVTGVGNPDGTLTFDFNVPNVRLVLTTTTKPGQSATNETVITTITNPAQEGLLTVKNSNGTTAKDSDGNDLTIVLPKTLITAQEIYNYLTGTILAANSTHPVKTNNVIDTITSGNFSEYYGETDLDHSGDFNLKWGFAYTDCILEFTTETGSTNVDYMHQETVDKIATVGTNSITIENASRTYTAGEYLKPGWTHRSDSFDQKVLSSTVSGTTTTVNFDTSYNSSMSGWYDYEPQNDIVLFDPTSLNSTNKYLEPIRQTADETFYESFITVKMGADVNIKLMLTNVPAVTIIPRTATENLYKFDKFTFTEVL